MSARQSSGIAGRVRERLESRGITTVALTRLIPGRHYATVYRMLSGTTPEHRTNTLLAVCGVLDAEIDELLDWQAAPLEPGLQVLWEETRELSEDDKWLVETELIPDYRAFRRQLQAGKSVLDRTGRIMEISASPWSPKFYGDLLRALGARLPTAAEQHERLSNKSQAFQFMSAVEESKAAQYQRMR